MGNLMNADAPFAQEFWALGKLARRALEGLKAVYLLYAPQGGREKNLLTDPEGEASSQVLAALEAFSAGPAAQPQEGRLFAAHLGLSEGHGLGAICLERAGRAWTGDDEEALSSVAAAYGAALGSQHHRRNAAFQQWVWNRMMDDTHACIYVTDPQTDRILFMNRYMKEAFGLKRPEGKVCWQVLQRGQQGRCAFCPVPELLKAGGPASRTWEEHNPVTGRIYENYDSMMRWIDGRMVHFQHSLDVTETRRLYKAAMTDELTGALSRLAGKQALEDMLRTPSGGQHPLSVCMLDVNGLKAVNDQHGHAAGDALLIQVAAAVRERLKEGESLMRLSGDEFVAVLPGVRQGEAAQRMEQILSDLQQSRPAFLCEGDAFCYGVVEVREPAPLQEVLARADERMYQQKRTLHIRRAQALLDAPQATPSPFAYDTTRLYDALVQSTDSYIYVCNMRTGVFRYPPAMVAEFGLPGEIVPNAAAVWGARVHPHDQRVFLEANQEIVDGRADMHCVEYRARNARGEWVWLRCRGHLERDAEGQPELFAGFITNLNKRNRLDPLTGLYNKFELEDDVERALEEGRALAFMMLDMDGLKGINSLYDRVFGDEVIRLTAQRLRSLLPAGASAYRLDGDEFAILLKGGDYEAASALFCRIQETFDCQQSFDGKKYYCTLSCGCAFAPGDGASYVDLANCAAYALERAKQRGRNRMELFSMELVDSWRRNFELTQLLHGSVERGFDGFEMHYQPVFDAQGGLIGAEALARWHCQPYGHVGPDQFIPLLERSGLILPVGRFLFERALSTCARWQKRMPGFEMSINLSYMQLEDEGFVEFMQGAVQRAGVNPRHVILELTESYLAANMEQIRQRLCDIRLSGFQVAMDDFGTGYSSLGVLKQSPIDIAKIDRAFVQGIHASPFDSAFLRLVVELCSVVGIKTCLEGVETQAQLEAVRPMALNYLQGYLLGKPMTAQAFEEQVLSQYIQ